MIYTSGSTGRPKGTEVSHINVARLFFATQPWYDFSSRDVWTLFHSFAFDFSVWELWGALCYGGRLVIVSHEVARSPEAFLALLERESVSVLNQTPSAFLGVMSAALSRECDLSGLRLVIFGGERLEPRKLKPWFDQHVGECPQLVNMYGITETTVHVSYQPLTVSMAEAGPSMIGRPIPDLCIYVLDPQLSPQPIGVSGELCIGGMGLARGYLGRPGLTAARFVPDPFGVEEGGRLYRTGDLGRWRSDGTLEFMGRLDHQVKVRGYRIELGEVEAALLDHPGVREAVVVCREDRPGDERLVAYVVGREADLSIEALRAHLGTRLPGYMVPSSIVVLDGLRLTANGKVDRRGLPAPEGRLVEVEYVGPRDAVEEVLSGIWSEVLGIDRVGIHDDFFELGGHSLLATQVMARIRESFEVDVPLRALFEGPSVAELGKVLVGLESAPGLVDATAQLMLKIEKMSDDEVQAELDQGASILVR